MQVNGVKCPWDHVSGTLKHETSHSTQVERLIFFLNSDSQTRLCSKGTTTGDGCSPQVLNGAFFARQRCSNILLCQSVMVNGLHVQSTRVTCYCSAALVLTSRFTFNTQVVQPTHACK